MLVSLTHGSDHDIEAIPPRLWHLFYAGTSLIGSGPRGIREKQPSENRLVE